MLARLSSLSGFKGYGLSFLLGALAVLGHAPFYLWPITILGFALFMLRLDERRALARPIRAGFWTGFAFGLGYFLFGLYWIGSAFIARGPEFIPIMPFAILGFCAGLSLFFAIAGALYVRLAADSLWRAGVFAALLFIAEFARGHILSGFPWNLPGYIFPAGKPLSQMASYVGVYGLSAFALFFAASLALALKNKSFSAFGVGLVILAGSYVFGSVRLEGAPIENTAYVPNVKLRIVHANIAQRDALDRTKFVANINRYLELSVSDGFEDITHVIWPEGAVPGMVFNTPGLMEAVETLFRSGRADPPVFITQTGRSHMGSDGDIDYYNSAVAVSFPKDGKAQRTPFYDKQKLVPFGEFFPGEALAKKLGLKTLSSAMASMRAGSTGFVPALPDLPPVSLQICYEIIFPGFTPKILMPSGEAPQWILNLSNDSWYGNSTGPRQHVNQVRYRAIEEGLPIIRATSGGISGVIDSFGRQLAQKNLDETGVLDVGLPQYMHKSAYKVKYDTICLLLIFLILVVCALRIQRAH